jgi:MoaA/NifB/PqqE/SkfB family radical SAM enzyme/DNA-binding Lrp family transcriptional regulator
MIPLIVDWRVTSACIMECPFCYGPKKINSMSKSDALSVVEKLGNLGVETICISGGEPLLYPHIVEVMKAINDYDIKIFLSTCGSLYLKKRKQIEDYIIKLSLPLDGYSPEIHLLNGRLERNHNEVLSILKYYKNEGSNFQIKIATLLTSKNIYIQDNLIKIHNLLMDYPVDIWKIYELLPEGLGATNYQELKYPTEDYIFATKQLNEEIKTNMKKTKNFQIVLSDRLSRDSGYFIIQPNGDVIIPEDEGIGIGVVNEKLLGNVLNDDVAVIVKRWQEQVNYGNYLSNFRIVHKRYELSEIDRLILFELDEDPHQRREDLVDNINDRVKAQGTIYSENLVNDRIQDLFDTGVIRNVIPIVNLDKLGFEVYLVNLMLGAVNKGDIQRIINYLVENPNIAWVAKCSGKWSIMIAVFAKGANQFRKIMRNISTACGDGLVDSDFHIVCEKYILGQRYLLIKDKRTGFLFDRSRIILDHKDRVDLSETDYLVLQKMRDAKDASMEYIAKQLSIPLNEVDSVVRKLEKFDVLKKFQPVYNIPLLGYEWYEIFIRFKNLTEDEELEFIHYIHEIPQVVHINCTIGAWDINFEIHSEDKEEFKAIYNSKI